MPVPKKPIANFNLPFNDSAFRGMVTLAGVEPATCGLGNCTHQFVLFVFQSFAHGSFVHNWRYSVQFPADFVHKGVHKLYRFPHA